LANDQAVTVAKALVVEEASMRIIWVGSLVALLLGSLPVAAGEALEKAVVVKQGEPAFTITLESNRTTGFSWYLASVDANLIEATGHVYEVPSVARFGAPGREVWAFRARPEAFAVPRLTHVAFRYMRPWEPDSARETRFTVILVPDE